MFNLGTSPVAMPYLLQTADLLSPPVAYSSTAASVGSQLLAALVVGLLTAFGLQLLLTNLGIAAGISILGFRSNQPNAAVAGASSDSLSSDAADSDSSSSDAGCDRTSAAADSSRSSLSFAAGLGIVLTIDTVLFAACFLATTFSQIHSPITGAIVGIVIWSAYFLILTWISLTTVSSLVSFVLGSAVAGFRQIFAVVNAAFSGSKQEPLSEAEAIALIQQELQHALSPAALQPIVENYLDTLSPPRIDPDAIRAQLATLLTEVDLQPLAATGALQQINRQTFVDLLRQHTPLTEPEVEQAVEQLLPIWQQTVDRYAQTDLNPDLHTELLRLLRSANPAELIQEQRPEPSHSKLLASLPSLDFKQIARSLINRVDWSELEIETVWQHLLQLKAQVIDHSDPAPAADPSWNVIQLDLENYLLNTSRRQLADEGVEPQVRSLLSDPEAAPEQVRSQLEQIQRQEIVATLNQRQDLSAEQVDAIADRVEAARLQVLATVKTAEAQEQYHHWRQQLERYLQTADAAALTAKALPRRLKTLLAEAEITAEAAVAGFNHRQLIADLLQEHTSLDAAEIEQVTDRLEQLGHRLQRQTAPDALEIQAVITELWQKLAAYLRYTNSKQLTPKQVDRKLQLLLNEAQEKLEGLQGTLPEPDQQQLKELLHRRKGLSKKQRHRILEQIQQTWSQVQPPAAAAGSGPEPMADRIAAYLATEWTEPVDAGSEGIAAGLESFKSALGAAGDAGWGLRRQLSRLDWQHLTDRLQQAGLSQPQILQRLEWTKPIVRQLLKPPRRWATRRPADFLNRLQDYLHQTDKAMFDPEAIKATLQRRLHEALPPSTTWRAAAVERLQAATLDRVAIRALLLQRPDLTEAEAARIAEQIESVWGYLLDQAELAQEQSQSLLDGFLSRLGSSFESLSLPSIDVNEVKQGLRQWFSSDADSLLATLPVRELLGSLEASTSPAIQALQDSLQQFSDKTLTRLLDSQPLSSGVRNYLLGQAEGLRDRLMQQVEQLQARAQQRVADLKLQAQRQMEATRRAAAAAAWWLFFTLSTGALSAATAGVLAARAGFN